MVTLRGKAPWRTVTAYHGVPHVQLTAVSSVDTHGGRRGWPLLAVVLGGFRCQPTVCVVVKA